MSERQRSPRREGLGDHIDKAPFAAGVHRFDTIHGRLG